MSPLIPIQCAVRAMAGLPDLAQRTTAQCILAQRCLSAYAKDMHKDVTPTPLAIAPTVSSWRGDNDRLGGKLYRFVHIRSECCDEDCNSELG